MHPIGMVIDQHGINNINSIPTHPAQLFPKPKDVVKAFSSFPLPKTFETIDGCVYFINNLSIRVVLENHRDGTHGVDRSVIWIFRKQPIAGAQQMGQLSP